MTALSRRPLIVPTMIFCALSNRLKEEDVGNAASAASGSDGLTPLQVAAHAQLPKLTRLRTLVLKDFGGAKVIEHFKH